MFSKILVIFLRGGGGATYVGLPLFLRTLFLTDNLRKQNKNKTATEKYKLDILYLPPPPPPPHPLSYTKWSANCSKQIKTKQFSTPAQPPPHYTRQPVNQPVYESFLVPRRMMRQPQGGTLIFSYIRRLGSIFGVPNFEFQYFLGFSEKYFFFFWGGGGGGGV